MLDVLDSLEGKKDAGFWTANSAVALGAQTSLMRRLPAKALPADAG